MAQVTVTIQTDNAAFDEENQNAELARIFRGVADRAEQGELALGTNGHRSGFGLRDINGNKVGKIAHHQDD